MHQVHTQDKIMAHFAKLGIGNKIETVLEVLDSIATSEQAGVDFLNSLHGTNDIWKQTYTDGTRKNYAGIGHRYDVTRDAFYEPQPYASWVLNESTCQWEASVAYPDDGKLYNWNEATTSWIEIVK
jgi:hypothetical protein